MGPPEAGFIRRATTLRGHEGSRSCPSPPPALLVTAPSAAASLDDNGSSGGGPDPNDKRAVALNCITNREGLDARLVGEKSIQVDGPSGPRAEFFVSSGEAEALQFQGDAQGAQQIGAALLVREQGE